MKKAILSGLIMTIVLMFSSWAVGANNPGSLSAPLGFFCILSDTDGDGVNDAACFDWEDVTDSVKYSLDIEAEVDIDNDGITDMTVELSFGTSDRTDGGLMGDSDICVPLSELVYDYDVNGDGEILDTADGQEENIPLSGPVSTKVKALAPGNGKGRQNNPFSTACDLTLP